MRALSRLLSWGSRLWARMRGQDSAIDPSNPDFQAFALDRYSPPQQREIARLVARQPVISRGNIAQALGRAERASRLSGQLTGFATGVGLVAMFVLGFVVAGRQAPTVGGGKQPVPSAPLPATRAAPAGAAEKHWSPGGLDEADRQFFADLEAGRISTAAAPPQPPAATPPVRTAAAQPAAPPAPQPMAPQRGTVIQLGAFADATVANARWQALATQFPELRPLTRSVSVVTRGGRTLYRLRASGADAASACSALALAGASCFVATDAG